MEKVLTGLLAILGGVGATLLIFWLLNFAVEHIPGKLGDKLKPWVFAGPAVLFISVFLVYPAIRTIVSSFLDRRSEEFVGLANYTGLLADPSFRSTMLNTLLWLLIVPALAVLLGLLVAVLADRLSARWEKVAKSLVFLPMAVSMVGAATIFRFIYAYNPPDTEQIGLLNSIYVALGGEPQVWLQLDTARVNSLLLMVILIWLQVGFAMVLLSAAIKGVPDDTIEAARMDGAGEVQAFFRIVVPQIWGTVITVFITILMTVLKVFDIVYVTTNGQSNTDVVANRFFKELFEFRDAGRAAAIVVLLLIVVTPVMAYQVRQFRLQEAAR